MTRPRLGFLGVGWIGRHRMQAILEAGVAEAVAIADPSPEMVKEAAALAPGAQRVSTLDDILACGVDGVVIATPSAMHAGQSIQAVERGAAVFCQKPLGRTAKEARAVVEAARTANRLLGVDLSYRFTEGMRQVRELVRSGALGRVFAIDLTFHNAYGPDKAWFYDPVLSGGGCVMDLGVHLVDLALWATDFPAVTGVESALFAGGEPLRDPPDRVEDYATASFDLGGGESVRLACSWRLHAGREAMIGAVFYGTEGGVAFRNVDGSFFDFITERLSGTSRQTLSAPPDAWGGRAAAAWARRLAAGEGFDPDAEQLVQTMEVLDRIYRR